MKSWLMKAFMAGAAVAALGAGSPALAQIVQQQATVLTANHTTCQELFADDPVPVFELVVPPSGGGDATGVFSDGVLKVDVSVTKGTKLEPTTLDWESLPLMADGMPTGVRAVVTQLGIGKSKIYLYPKNALFDSGLTGPSSSSNKIVRTRFCYGGTTPTLAKFATCPLQGPYSDSGSELRDACDQSGALFFFYYDILTSDAGPREGEGPALCRCTDTFFTCNPSLFREQGACFGTDAQGNPLGNGIVESAVAAESNNLVRYDFNPRCRTKCYDLDGVRVCERYCK
ncbi:MAG: hypothetical protein OEM59_05030 [Rhodospirillales bacterium]|nr:hypothetical protein [Rhodospirillales bacterium]